MNPETWRGIEGWEGKYEVSDYGQVRSVDRTILVSNPKGVLSNRTFRGKLLAAPVGLNGYRMVTLTAPNRKREYHYVHHLVLRAFVGPRPDYAKEIRHLDGDKLNCRLENLKYGTCAENASDRRLHGQMGVQSSGCAAKNSKLSEVDVLFIRENPLNLTHRQLGKIFKVSHSRIGAVLRGESYA